MASPRTVLDRLLEITELFERDLERSFAGTELTKSRVHLLWVLGELGPSTQRVLADALGVSPRNVSALVDALEATGHVVRAPHPDDRRATIVTLSASSRETMRRMAADHAALSAELLGAVDEADRAAFERGLDAVAARLHALIEAEEAP